VGEETPRIIVFLDFHRLVSDPRVRVGFFYGFARPPQGSGAARCSSVARGCRVATRDNLRSVPLPPPAASSRPLHAPLSTGNKKRRACAWNPPRLPLRLGLVITKKRSKLFQLSKKRKKLSPYPDRFLTIPSALNTRTPPYKYWPPTPHCNR
jgi:hypothetical protein